MRQVNLRFLLATIVIVAATAGVVHGVHTLQYRKHAGAWKKLADAAEGRGDTRQQIDYLRRYTALGEAEAADFETLGNLLIESNRFAEAQLPLATALNRYEANDDQEAALRMRRALVEAALNSGRWADADTQLDKLIDESLDKDANDPAQAEYREQRARCRGAAALWADAAKELERAIGHDPSRCDAYGMLAEIEARELNRPESAVERLHTMVVRNPESERAYRIRSEFRLMHATDLPVCSAEAAQLQGGGASATNVAPLPLPEMLRLAADDAAASLQRNADAAAAALARPTDDAENVKAALQRKADQSAALVVSMRCAHILSGLVAPTESPAKLQEAAAIANQIIAGAQAEVERREAEYKARQEKLSADAAKDDATSDGATTAEATKAADKVEVPAKLKAQWTREAFISTAPAYNVLADTRLRVGKPDEAVRILTDAVEKIGNDETLVPRLLSLKLSLPGQGDNVERLFGMLGQRRETKALHDYMRVRQKIAAGDSSTAMRELQSVLPSLERWPQARQEAKLLIASARLQLSDPLAAERLYREVLQGNPSLAPAQWGLAVALDQQGRGADALSLYMQILENGMTPSDPNYPDVLTRVARAMIASIAGKKPEAQDWQPPLELLATARSQVAELDPKDVSPAVLDTLDVIEAELFLARKQPDSAVQLLTSAVARSPQSMTLWLALIAVHDSQEQWDAALETMTQAQAAIGSDEPAKVAQLILSRGRHHAKRLAASLRDAGLTEGSGAGIDGGTTPEQVRNALVEQARTEVGALIDSIPPLRDADAYAKAQYINVLEQFANLCRALQDNAKATGLYEDISRLDRNHLQSVVARLELALVSGDLDVVVEMLKEVERIQDRRGPIWNYANATLLALKAADPKHAQERRSMLNEAEVSLRVAESSWPGKVSVRRLRAHIFRQQDRITDAVELDLQVFRDGFAVPPDFVTQLVRDLYELNRYDEAAEVLTRVNPNAAGELLGLAPAAMEMSGVVSDAQQSQQLRTLAIELSRVNAEKTPDFRTRLAHGLMLLRGEDPAGARTEFEAARDLAPDEAEPWLALIELDVREGQVDSAKELLERAAQAIRESDRAIALARGYGLVNDPERAQQYLREALASVPEDLTTATPLQAQILALASEAYLQRAQQEEALARRLAAGSPEESTKHRQLAVALNAQGVELLERLHTDGRLALSKLGTGTDAKGDAEAQSRDALRKLLSNQIPIVVRRLALVKLAKGGAESLQKARQLVDENRVNGEFRSPEDLRLSAIILSQSSDAKDKEQALTDIRKLLTSTKGTPRDEDRLLAATLHLSEYRRLGGGRVATGSGAESNAAPPETPPEARRHLEEARTLMREIVVTNESRIRPARGAAESAVSPTYVQALVGLIEILLANREISDAEFYIGRLTQADPESQTTMGAVATLHFEKGEADSAIESVRRFGEAGPDEERASRRLTASQLLESFGTRSRDETQAGQYFEAAEQALAELSASDPKSELLLAGFRARRGRVAEAIAVIEASATTASDVQLTSASVHAMRAAGQDTQLLDRLTAALEEGLAANPKSVPLRLMLADLHTWIGRADAAEVLYREVLDGNPKHGAAANNLAFLLASQQQSLDEALALINEVIAEQGAIAELLDTRAYVYIRRGGKDDLTKAVTDLTVALNTSRQPTYLYHLVEAQVALKSRNEAKATWKQAHESGLSESTLHPLEREAYRALAAQMSRE